MDDRPERLEVPAPAAAVPHLALKATALLVLMIVLVCGAALYVMYARGVFEPTQRLVLIAENSEGVVAGMDLTFSGFPIGRVRRLELGADGNARIVIDVPRDDAHWLRTTSVFTLVRNLVGGIFGTREWMSELARHAGSRTSAAKAKAARENGRKGGRPRKTITDARSRTP